MFNLLSIQPNKELNRLRDLTDFLTRQVHTYETLWLRADREVKLLNRAMGRRNRRIKRQMAALRYYRDKERQAVREANGA